MWAQNCQSLFSKKKKNLPAINKREKIRPVHKSLCIEEMELAVQGQNCLVHRVQYWRRKGTQRDRSGHLPTVIKSVLNTAYLLKKVFEAEGKKSFLQNKSKQSQELMY